MGKTSAIDCGNTRAYNQIVRTDLAPKATFNQVRPLEATLPKNPVEVQVLSSA
jgi:hypothetical protein